MKKLKLKNYKRKKKAEKNKENKNENKSDQNLSDKNSNNFIEFEAKKLAEISKIKENRKIRIEKNPEREEKILANTNERIEKIQNKIKERKEKMTEKNENKQEKISEPLIDQKNSQENKPSVHNNISCNGCKVFPIVGIRYKCVRCEDFDFCEKCEEANWKEHKHPMTKLRTPRPRFGMNGGCRRFQQNSAGSIPSPKKANSPVKNFFKKFDNQPLKNFVNEFIDKITGMSGSKKFNKGEDNEELKNKKRKIQEILKDYKFTGKEIKSALILTKLDVNKALNLLKNGL